MATLLELKTKLATEFGLSDQNSLASAEASIKYWYQHIWNAAIWNDTKIRVNATYTANATSLTLDSTVDLVIAITCNDFPLSQINQEELFKVDTSYLSQSNTPISYISEPRDSSDNCVIRLVPLPSEDVSLLVLAKKRFVQLTGDSDSPKLKGIDETLLMFARADRYRRDNQLNKYTQFYQLGMTMLNQMADIENNQQQKSYQIIPDTYDAMWESGRQYSQGNKTVIYGY